MCAETDPMLVAMLSCVHVCAVTAGAVGRTILVQIAVVRQPRLHGLHSLRAGRRRHKEEAQPNGAQLWWDDADLHRIGCVRVAFPRSVAVVSLFGRLRED